ncbi:hypothetical protein B0J13DRAFT_111455 [Dactylonectria estremocensis]|uniref:Zn(2)-C6 fungal-type domain-containing protein n=1 Tax=Dactylonectria estremocensis TaxID=1079267 RepID=A0A9P9JAQ4_9HYPO|nr:hypothetical protein B0J13DRAFT_111455 [Dactylonectria estremocensis]
MASTPQGEHDASHRRASCEQCRQKKLKCDGEYPGCGRCLNAGEICKYSVRRPMGRPKKRKVSETENQIGVTASNDALSSFGERETPPDLIGGMDMNGLTFSPELAFDSGMGTTDWGCDTSVSTNTDPALQEVVPSSGKPSCSCLASLYLSLEEMRSTDVAPFTTGLVQLRTVTARALAILQCPICPGEFVWAMQNSQLLNTLLVSIAETYRRLIEFIEQEAERATSNNESKVFFISETQPGDPGMEMRDGSHIPPSFSLALNPARWESLVKEAVKADVFGSPHSSLTSFSDVLQLMEERQLGWHSGALPSCVRVGVNHHNHPPDKEPTCVMMVRHTKAIINGFSLDS